jgi:hypothetical protein
MARTVWCWLQQVQQPLQQLLHVLWVVACSCEMLGKGWGLHADQQALCGMRHVKI